ncbi:hypothetical protein [Myxococcus eversor]|uniref:hypothetical protein n=1 Tax=Myxococcus eversor TaxID=2709661 RepID=UPI0013D11441|nr:hypothetical protein [Myxococcus eversor]
MTYEEAELYGANMYRMWAGQAASEARAKEAAVAEGRDSRGRTSKAAREARERETQFLAKAEDTARYLWLITVGNIAQWHWVGTEASACGSRVAKAKWERSLSNMERLRPARDDEPNGDLAEAMEQESLAQEAA